MALKSSRDLVVRLQKLEQSMSPAAARKRMTEVGVRLKPLATAAARPDLGSDAAFSRWRKKDGSTMPLEAAFKVHKNGQAITMHRHFRSAGPWRVAQEGRKEGMSRGRKGGARRRGKDGVITTSVFKASRPVSASKGKGTWDKAQAAMSAKAPAIMRDLNREAVLKAFSEGVL